MNSEKETIGEPKISRRGFLKSAGILSVAGAMSTLPNIPGFPGTPSEASAAVKLGREQDSFPVEIAEDYKRMDHKNIVFMRTYWDPAIKPMNKNKPPLGKPGWTELDLALKTAAWAINDSAAPLSQVGIPKAGSLYAWEGRINPRKTTFKSPEEASSIVKQAALFLGASLVGIAPYDERWVYTNWYDPKAGQSIPVTFPFEPKSVIAIALEMNRDAFRTAPSLIASAACGDQYSNMATTAHKVATFVRQLGYQAIPLGNDTALSIPIAVQAGLGELSRMGLIITEKYGPRVRLCKVFTDLELKTDKPVTFGVTQFCEVCLKCADNCPSKAISKDPKAGFKPENISNNPGVKKWCVDAEKCYSFWDENGGDCGNCIESCPYNKTDEWNHDLAKLATLSPAKPLLRYFDELFGYGKVYNEKAIAGWWKK